MESKQVKKFVYEGLGFPIALINVRLVKIRGIWTPFIDYNRLQRDVILALAHKPTALTGNEIHFIRAYFEMTLDAFGKQFGLTHAGVLHWEKAKKRAPKINPTTELCIRLFILEKLDISNRVFREAFRDFDAQKISKTPAARILSISPLTKKGIQPTA